MQRDPKIYLQDVCKAIEKIERYVESLGFREFSTNEMVQDAVLRNLEIIGRGCKENSR